MTQQQVIALIQQWIVANGNEEITADVLRPILEAMVNQPNDLIGDLNDLTTTNKDTIVDAINEVNNLSNGGITIHYGSDTPFTTPPVSFELGDFYAQLDGSSVLGFWQYNGNEWVEIKESSAITLEGYHETGTREDGNLEVIIGDYDNSSGGTKITIDDDDGVIFLEGFTEIRGYDGELRLTRRQDNKYVDLKASNVTDNRAFQFPDKSGTFALLDDISSSGVQSVTGDGVGGTPEDVVLTFPTPSEIGAQEQFTTDESLYLDPITNELRANVSDFSEKYTYTSGVQEFVLISTPVKIIYISVNGQLLEDPLTQWSIDVPTKTITILDEMKSGDRVTIHYQYFITI